MLMMMSLLMSLHVVDDNDVVGDVAIVVVGVV